MITSKQIKDGSIKKADLSTGIKSAFYVFAAGETTTTGGDAAESTVVAGALATDLVVATLLTKGGTPRTILTAAAAADAVNLEFSGDPSNDHVYTYVVYRATS